MRYTSAAFVFGVLGWIAAASTGACVGSDDSRPAPVVPTDSGATTPPSGSDAGGTDAGVVCATGMGDCDADATNGCETDLRTTPAHCGRCERACGGGAVCQASECSVEKLRDGLDHPFSLARAGARLIWHEPMMIRGCRADDCASSTVIMADVEGMTTAPTVKGSPRQIGVVDGSFYFSQCGGSGFDCGVAQCDATTGCKLSGSKQLWPADNRSRRTPLVVASADAIYTFQGIDGTFRTRVKPTVAVEAVGTKYRTTESVQAIAVDATSFVFLDSTTSQANPTGGVFSCPIAGCTSEPTVLLPQPVKHLARNTQTVLTSSGGNPASVSIIACAATGCGGTGKVLAQAQAYVSDIAADDAAVYWTTVGAADPTTNSAPVGTVMRCALPDCAGGPTKIAENQVNPIAVQLDESYVSWLTYGSPGQKDGAIFRRRR